LVPIDLGRDAAAAKARVELSDPAYRRDGEPWFSRVLNWAIEHIQDWLGRLSSSTPGGWLGIALIVVVIVGLLAVLRMRLGPLRQTGKSQAMLFGDEPTQTAAAHRRFADECAEGGRYRDAIRERMRAVVRELEERAVFESRQGRTADEAANAAARVLPDVAVNLHEAARTFDASWYGEHQVDADTYARMTALDSAIATSARSRRAGSAVPVTSR